MPHLAMINGTSRTAKYMIPRALAEGHRVTAIVRSTKRFYATQEKHDNLIARELSDWNDVKSVSELLSGVDVIFVTLMMPTNEPCTLLEDVVQTLVAAIRAFQPKEKKLPRIVLLSSVMLLPRFKEEQLPQPTRFVRNNLINYIIDDLERAQRYLEKQASWLEYVSVCAGGIVDVPDSDAKASKGWNFSPTEDPELIISYERLAAAMLGTLEDWDKWKGQAIAPIPTSKVAIGFSDMKTQRELMGDFLKKVVLLPTLRVSVFVALGWAMATWKPWTLWSRVAWGSRAR